MRRRSIPCDWRKNHLHVRTGPLPHPGSLAGHSWSELCDTVTPPWEITIPHQSAGREGRVEEKQQITIFAECRIKECFTCRLLKMYVHVVHTSFPLDYLNCFKPWQCSLNSSNIIVCVYTVCCCQLQQHACVCAYVQHLYSKSLAVELLIPFHKWITKWGVEPSGESPVIPSGTNLPLTSWNLVPLIEHSRNCISFSVSVPVLSVNTYST